MYLFPLRHRKESAIRPKDSPITDVSIHHLPELVFREAMDRLSKCRSYGKLNGNLDSNTRAQDIANSCPIENWHILVSGRLLATCSSPGIMAHQQLEGRGLSAGQKWDSISRCELLQRQGERRRVFRRANSTHYEQKTLLCTFQNPLLHLLSSHLLGQQRDARAGQQEGPYRSLNPAHSFSPLSCFVVLPLSRNL